MMKRFFLTLAALASLSSIALGQGYDIIYLHEGGRKQGTVVEMSKDAVTLDISGAKIPVEVGTIKRLTFADAPAELTAAQSSIASGQFENAVERLEGIDRGDIQRPIVEAEVDYYLAFCKAKLALAGAADADETSNATAAMMKLAGNTGSYHYYEANELTGDLALAIGRPDKAAEFYANVSQAKWPEYKMRAFVLEGQAKIAPRLDEGDKPDYRGAYEKFQQVIGAPLNTPLASHQKDLAAIGKAVCLAEAGQADNGIKEAEKIIAERDSRDGALFGKAYNALGHCYLKAGQNDQALLAYLHVHLLFYQDPAEHAEALYHLRSLWRQARNDATRALEAGGLLKQRYPNSVWTKKAAS